MTSATLGLLASAKSTADNARQAYITAAKDAINNALGAVFDNREVKNVVFGVSTDPYNDENSGQGVFGPDVNVGLLDTEDGSVETEFGSDEEYALFYDRSSNPKAKALDDVLNVVGWEIAGEALGVSYYPGEGSGSTSVFIAERDSSKPRGFALTEQEIGY